LHVTEHRAAVKLCPRTGREVVAAFPQGVHAPAQSGPRFQSLLSYWRHQQLLPLDRITPMCADLFGQPLSEATGVAIETKLYDALAPFEQRVHALLCQAALVHFDETGVRVAGSLHWLHNASTSLVTWFGIHKKRGHQAMDAFGILPRFLGRAIHDGLASYFRYPCLHGLCGAHLCRERVFLHEVLRQRWARPMYRLLLKMLDAVRVHAPRPPPERRIAALLRRYRMLLARGLRQNPRRPSTGRRGRPRQTKAYNLLRRLRDQEACAAHTPQISLDT
jgi:transposase